MRSIKNSYVPSIFSNNREEFLTPFDKIFDEFFNSSYPEFQKNFGIDFFSKGSYPKCDIIEYSDKVQFELEIPGVDKSDITIETEIISGGRKLVISGKKSQDEKEEIDGKFLRHELKRSSFQRSFALNENHLDGENIQAEFKDGILRIIVPKKQIDAKEDSVKKIEIK